MQISKRRSLRLEHREEGKAGSLWQDAHAGASLSLEPGNFLDPLTGIVAGKSREFSSMKVWTNSPLPFILVSS